MSVLIAWQSGSQIVKDASDLEGVIYFPVSVPGQTTTPLSFLFYVQSDIPVQTLLNAKLYLSGDTDSVNTIQSAWPYISATRPELNGGLELSLDNGRTFQRFTTTLGFAGNSATWILLPASATSFATVDGTLGSDDVGGLQLRLVIPPGVTQFQKYSFNIEIDCDVR